MNKWLVFIGILAVIWFVALPALGISSAFNLATGLFVIGTLFLLKGIPQTKQYLPAMPTFGVNPLILAGVIFVIGMFWFGWFASYTGGITMGGIFGSVAGGETTDTATDSNPLSSSTTAVVYIADELSGSAINTNYGYRTIGSTAWVTGSGSSISLTADVGDEYEIAVSPDNTTTYGSLSTIKIPKGYSPKFTVKVGTIATPATVKKVIKNTDSAVNSVTNPENMAGSDKSTFLFTVTGEYNKYQGSSFGGTSIMSCKYNTSAFNKILVQDSNGVTYSTTGVSSPPTLTGASGFTYSAFAMPSIASNSQLNGQLYVEAGSTAPDANTGNITCFIEDAQLFYNSDTNLYEYGVVDEGNSGLGQTATQTNFTLYIS